MGWWHAARPPEPAGPDGGRHPGPNRGVLTRASGRDGSPEVTVILTLRNRGPTRRRQRASPRPIRTPLPNGHRNLLSQGVATTGCNRDDPARVARFQVRRVDPQVGPGPLDGPGEERVVSFLALIGWGAFAYAAGSSV